MKRKARIALAPIKYFESSKQDNTERIVRCIQSAKHAKADIICFPESCLHKKRVLSMDGPILNEVKEACKKNSIWAIVTDDVSIQGKLYSVAVLINRKGNIAGHYKKINLYDDDTNRGREVKVFNTDFGKIGLAICWDLAFPKLFNKLKEKGAQIVFCPTWWAYEARAHKKMKHSPYEQEIELMRSLVSSRAFENLFFVAICNPITNWQKDDIPYSAIVSPHKIIRESINNDSLVVEDINLNEINELEKVYKNYFKRPLNRGRREK